MPPSTADAAPLPAEELAERSRPRVVAALTNGTPLLVERRIGVGRVLWFSSGLSSNWSTLALTNTMLLLDRICRDLLQATFPRRNLDTNEPISMPVSAADRSARFVLTGPEGRPQVLAADAVGADRYAVTAANPARRGHYQLAAFAPAAGGRESPLWEVPLAVNGPAEESDLRGPEPASGKSDAAEGLWVADRSEVAQEASAAGQNLWRWFMLAALVCLLLELGVLAAPMLGRADVPVWRRLLLTWPEPVRWLADSRTSMLACVLPMLWAGAGPGCLIYLAALKGVPDDLYEAAEIDGAGFADKILFVVVPVLRPLLTINFIGVFIGAWLHAGGHILAMTGGAAGTEVAELHIFYKAFVFLQFGPATAMAWVLGSLLIGFTIQQLRMISRHEFRAAGEDR